MGYLLKEALKTLCGINQWSYAVFWKIGFQNPRLLIWEECYHEPTPCSALPHIARTVSSEIAFEEWEACLVSPGTRTPQISLQSKDEVGSLINKMMMRNRVNVEGEGLVGRAAFAGDHMWILSENYAKETHPPEVQNELSQQFSSGMKTVAVIPVLTHGVVQLGSSLAITENMPFVNDVKSLILQLGHVPGALLSNNYISKEPAPKLGVPVCLGKSVSTDSSVSYKGKHCVSHVAEQSISSRALELICQPSHCLIRQIEDNPQGTSSAIQPPIPAQNVVRSQDSFCQPKINPELKPSLPFTKQLENGETGAEIILSNPVLWLEEPASLYNPRPGFSEQSCGSLSSIDYSNLRLMEEHILSDVLQEYVSNSLSTSSGFITSQPRTNRGGSSSSCQLLDGVNSHPRTNLNCCALPTANASANLDVSWMNLIGSGPNASRIQVSTSDLTDSLANNHLFSRSSDLGHHPNVDDCSQMEVAHRKERTEDDLFQAFSIPLAHLDEPKNLIQNISGSCDGSQKHDYGNQNPSSKNGKYKDDFVQSSSGDDLFDILGPDFKSKLFHESWNNFLNDGPDRNTNVLGKDNCKSLHLEDVNSELYSVSGGNSVSCVLSGAGSDHLLDAIVNTAHTAAKQSSDDSVSCRTILTQISSSSLPSASPSHGRGVFDKMQGELFRHPKSLKQLGVVGSCSFKSGCSKEDAGNYSQTSSIHGSQISSWVEQGLSAKQTNSASTKYSKRSDEVSKSHRKRLKPGENPRPRPKDRQMIQDRMKELREIVPNGAKCSIDALLERTIKHMLFLQSVTKHADKLQQTGESKINGKDGGLLLKDNFEGGRTWAYEVGSQSMVCPIIVEDLNAPRQMLVEMLCEEHDRFLEIADLIRGLGLTILKGLMETRNDKIWARFAVEANRDVTRMEIFLSLVHLLEETIKSCAASGNDIEHDNMMVHPSFHQAASIPANW